MNIFSCVDYQNIDKIMVLFYSVYKNSTKPDDLNFYLIVDKDIDYKFPNFIKDKIKMKKLELNDTWKEIYDDFSKYFFYGSGHCNNLMNFARFFIFDLFPEIDRVIYLDWDMIVKSDIFRLEQNYLSDNLVYSQSTSLYKKLLFNIFNYYEYSTNVLPKIVFNYKGIPIKIYPNKKQVKDYFKKYTDMLNVDINKDAFNAGFFMVSKEHFDLTKIEKIFYKLIKIQKENPVFCHGTQIIMNLIDTKYEKISDLWNCKKNKNGSHIVHWTGSNKPWILKDPLWMKYKNELDNLI
jgi:lipopolysaccharide biosynthesis glycosyltransferase